eukprot:gene10385-biopygen2903
MCSDAETPFIGPPAFLISAADAGRNCGRHRDGAAPHRPCGWAGWGGV